MGLDRKAYDAAIAALDFNKFTYRAELDTNKGPIRLELFEDAAPNHVKNFIGLIDAGFYNNVIFHRVIKDFVIQAGCPEGRGTGGPGFKIAAEFNSRKHEPGTLSMARTSDPNSAGSQFYLCLKRLPHLDGKYTVFGKVADQESMDTVEAIGDQATDSGDRPLEEVQILKAKVHHSSKA